MPVRLRLGFADRLAAFSAVVLATAIAATGVAASIQVRQAMTAEAHKTLDGAEGVLRLSGDLEARMQEVVARLKAA